MKKILMLALFTIMTLLGLWAPGQASAEGVVCLKVQLQNKGDTVWNDIYLREPAYQENNVSPKQFLAESTACNGFESVEHFRKVHPKQDVFVASPLKVRVDVKEGVKLPQIFKKEKSGLSSIKRELATAYFSFTLLKEDGNTEGFQLRHPLYQGDPTEEFAPRLAKFNGVTVEEVKAWGVGQQFKAPIPGLVVRASSPESMLKKVAEGYVFIPKVPAPKRVMVASEKKPRAPSIPSKVSATTPIAASNDLTALAKRVSELEKKDVARQQQIDEQARLIVALSLKINTLQGEVAALQASNKSSLAKPLPPKATKSIPAPVIAAPTAPIKKEASKVGESPFADMKGICIVLLVVLALGILVMWGVRMNRKRNGGNDGGGDSNPGKKEEVVPPESQSTPSAPVFGFKQRVVRSFSNRLAILNLWFLSKEKRADKKVKIGVFLRDTVQKLKGSRVAIKNLAGTFCLVIVALVLAGRKKPEPKPLMKAPNHRDKVVENPPHLNGSENGNAVRAIKQEDEVMLGKHEVTKRTPQEVEEERRRFKKKLDEKKTSPAPDSPQVEVLGNGYAEAEPA